MKLKMTKIAIAEEYKILNAVLFITLKRPSAEASIIYSSTRGMKALL